MDSYLSQLAEKARNLDAKNILSQYRSRFYIPDGSVYMDGNSLGLLSADAERSLLRVLDEWKTQGIEGWMKGENPWFWFAEKTGARASGLVGATEKEVVLTGTTTVNIHTLIGTFYKPEDKRTLLIADELNFPSDIYALQGQIRLKGLDPDKHLIMAASDDRGFLTEDSIIELMNDRVALVFLPSVLYRSGQLLDVAKLTAAANERSIPIGFDCSHSAGVVPHHFNDWGVDFAVWCSYKYLNGGPGSAAFLYVNQKHFSLQPSLPGWFGNDKSTQFDMLTTFRPAASAGRWQISTPGILGSSPVEGALEMIMEAGIENIREGSLQLTGFLTECLETMVITKYPEFKILTPKQPNRRGGHIALMHPAASQINESLLKNRIITDLRPPDIIRIAPVPLYNTFEEVYRVAESITDIMADLLKV